MSGDDLARNTADAKLAIDRCEQELAGIKNGLRNLGKPLPNEEDNTLIVKWIKIDGLPETAAPKLTINISSPILSAELSKLYSGVSTTSTSTSTVDNNDGKLDDKSWTMTESVTEEDSATNDTKTVSTEEETTTTAATTTTATATVDTASRGSSDDEFFDANTIATENEIKSSDTAADAAAAVVVATGDDESPPVSNTLDATNITISALDIETPTTTTTESKTVSEEVDVIVSPVSTTESGNDTFVTFRGIEVLQATLSIDAIDADIPLGSSVAYELAPYTSQLYKSDTDAKVFTSELPVAIFPPSNDNNDNNNNDYDGLEIALCTVTLQLEYSPSLKDKREELFGKLTMATKKKELAIEKLRKAAMAQATATAAATRAATKSTSETAMEQQKTAVKAGFLNKKSIKSAEASSSSDDRGDVTTAISMTHAIMKMYDLYFGPTSFLRMYVPLAKNYLLFFGFVALSHFKGYMFALPQPV